MFPPSVMRFRIRSEERWKLRLWIPLFLIWPWVVLIAILVSPLVLLAALLAVPWGKSRMILLLGPYAFLSFCSIRGLTIDVNSKKDVVLIKFV